MTEKVSAKIYVASLADYNAGHLHGRWLEAGQHASGVRAEIAEMLAESKEPMAEEWAIHDFEGFGGVRLSEYEDIETVCELAELISHHGEIFAALCANFGGTDDIEYARKVMENGYNGAHESLADYAQELVEDCYSDALNGLPDFIKYNIDWKGIGSDFELNGDIFTVEHDGKVHVFDSNV